jgi:ABC-type bacteriocin/lantibiotic exporter with double-glycine peptidase domain
MLDDRYRAIDAFGLDPHAAEPPTQRLPGNLVAVPAVKQVTDFSCGAAATLSVLRLWRTASYADTAETDLHGALETTDAQGTEPEPMEEYLRVAAQLKAEYRHGDVTLAQLLAAVDRGEPPIVDLQAWRDRDRPWRETWDAGHYVVLAGYDAERLYVMDPSVLTPGAYAYLPIEELEERWHDLAGPHEVPLQRMAIFVAGDGPRWRPAEVVAGTATRLK